MLSILLALTAGTPTPAAPVRYHIAAKSTTEVDLSALGQGNQTYPVSVSAYVSVTVSDSGAGHLVHVVIDSSSFDAGAAAAYLPPEMVASPNGIFYHLYVVHGSSVGTITPSRTSFQAAQLAPAIALLLPGLRAGQPGDTWADTVRTDTTVAGTGTNSGTNITTWTVKSVEGGVQQIEGVIAGKSTVGGAQMQMELSMAGTIHTSAPSGGLASDATSKASGQANMSMGGNNVPMKMTLEMTATKLP